MSEAALASQLSEHAAAIDDLQDDTRALHIGYGKVLGAISEMREELRESTDAVRRLEARWISGAAPASGSPSIRSALLDKVIIAGLCSGFWVIAELVKLAIHH